MRTTAHELTLLPKSLELENRVGKVEILVRDMRDAHDELMKRVIALQAQLDHIVAKIRF